MEFFFPLVSGEATNSKMCPIVPGTYVTSRYSWPIPLRLTVFSGPSGENTPKGKKLPRNTPGDHQGAHSRLSARKSGRLAQEASSSSQSHPHIGPCTETRGGCGATTANDWLSYFSYLFFISWGPSKASRLQIENLSLAVLQPVYARCKGIFASS